MGIEKKLTRENFDNAKKKIESCKIEISNQEMIVVDYKKQLIREKYPPCKEREHDFFIELDSDRENYANEICKKCFFSKFFKLFDGTGRSDPSYLYENGGTYKKTKEDEKNYKAYQEFVRKVKNEEF